MVKLEDISVNTRLIGITSSGVVTVEQVKWIGDDCIQVLYEDSQGNLSKRLLYRADEESLDIETSGRPWSFDGDGELFRLAAEAYRIRLAHLFDPLMAVHTSDVEPLPHQITAVYESMLPKQPLRFVLADDPGAGKTIMAGLLVRELMLRGDVYRCMIVAPGGLVAQWQDELFEKFGLEFDIFDNDMVEASPTGNPFEEKERLICRLDQLSRNDDYLAKIESTDWDLIIVDEAHKMSAHYYGNKINKTKRFRFGELLSKVSRHFLLMTATPHNGKEEDFQLFLSLIDGDRFYGKYKDAVHTVDVEDIMRRMIKEKLYRFDGTPLFPPRKAYSAAYSLSQMEQALYDEVTQYVREEFNNLERITDDNRKGTVGFALMSLQRRLASSPLAIFKSLERRRARLQKKIREIEELRRAKSGEYKITDEYQDDWWVKEDSAGYDVFGDLDEMDAEEQEEKEDEVISQATAARSIEDLNREIFILENLEKKAKDVLLSKEDRKWDELSKLLQDDELMFKPDGNRRKLIIFTEHKDTLYYLQKRLLEVLGDERAIISIYGGTKRDERRRLQELFWNDKDVTVLVATDAASEGVNLHCANLMINYDMPWNPNRLEQRFGRIHRIGQDEICHLWNMYASNTREGDVFARLQEKLTVEMEALGGKVFDILGEAFEEEPLHKLLERAIRYGDDPEVKRKITEKIDGALSPERLNEIIKSNALCDKPMTKDQLFEKKEELERAEARKLQPYFVASYFKEAFRHLGGLLKSREEERFEISHVPGEIRAADRRIGSRQPVLTRYARICFQKDQIRIPDKPVAALISPGHPLLDSVNHVILERYRDLLRQGTVLIDPEDPGLEPRVLFTIEHEIRDGSRNFAGKERIISQRMQFIEMDRTGEIKNAGCAPYLDYKPTSVEEYPFIENYLDDNWVKLDLVNILESFAAQHLVPDHYEEVKGRRERFIDKVHEEVRRRLTREINRLDNDYKNLLIQFKAGKQPQVNVENARQRGDELRERLRQREDELRDQRHVVSSPPQLIGGALIIPQGLINVNTGKESDEFTADADARKRIEMIAMKAVMDHEQSLGFEPEDVSKYNRGWDIESRQGKGNIRMIEVKGRRADARSVTITRNELLQMRNQDGKVILALVLVDGESVDGPHYIEQAIDFEPGFAMTSVNFDINRLLSLAKNRRKKND